MRESIPGARADAPRTGGDDYTVASVSFEPGARSSWHTHPAGQTRTAIEVVGCYQEKSKTVGAVIKIETLVCDPNSEHSHGTSPEGQMTHLEITNDTGAGNVVWLKPVTDEEYNAAA